MADLGDGHNGEKVIVPLFEDGKVAGGFACIFCEVGESCRDCALCRGCCRDQVGKAKPSPSTSQLELLQNFTQNITTNMTMTIFHGPLCLYDPVFKF